MDGSAPARAEGLFNPPQPAVFVANAAVPAQQPPSLPVSTSGNLNNEEWVKLAASFYHSWTFQYVVIFVGVVIMLYVMQPPFVLAEIPPHEQQNYAYSPGVSFRAVVIVSSASVACAALAPMMYRNWDTISSTAKDVADAFKSTAQK